MKKVVGLFCLLIFVLCVDGYVCVIKVESLFVG